MQIIFREDGLVKKILHGETVPNIGETVIIRSDEFPNHTPTTYKVIDRIMDIGNASCGMWNPYEVTWHVDIKKKEEISNID